MILFRISSNLYLRDRKKQSKQQWLKRPALAGRMAPADTAAGGVGGWRVCVTQTLGALASLCSYSARTGFWVRLPHPPTWPETQPSILPNEATLLLVCCLWLVLTLQDAEICFSSVIYQSLLPLALESGVFSSTRRPANNWYLASFTQALLIITAPQHLSK